MTRAYVYVFVLGLIMIVVGEGMRSIPNALILGGSMLMLLTVMAVIGERK